MTAFVLGRDNATVAELAKKWWECKDKVREGSFSGLIERMNILGCGGAKQVVGFVRPYHAHYRPIAAHSRTRV